MKKKTLLELSIILMFATLVLFSCDRDETYIVSFDANGGSGRMQSQLFDAGVPQALIQNAYTRDGYTFSGWNTMQAGNGTAYTNGQTITITSDMILYAQWTSNGTSVGGQSGSGTHTGGNGVLNGHEYVDLGLPSGTKWATCNVGANIPEGYGDYFAWGETTPKDDYWWDNYKYSTYGGWNDNTGRCETLTKYCQRAELGYNGFTDTLTILQSSDDAATVNWGSGWRMPTIVEFRELEDNCTETRTIQNGVYGRLFFGSNGNSLFLPDAGIWKYLNLSYSGYRGYYWSSENRGYLSDDALCFVFDSDNSMQGDCCPRCFGMSVRPVCNR